MYEVTFSELRSHAKRYFDIVEAGKPVRVTRNGKQIADIVPLVPNFPSWKHTHGQPLVISGQSLSNLIMEEREAGF